MKLSLALVFILMSAMPVARAADPPPEQAPLSVPLISTAELQSRIENQDPDLVILDVRTPEEFAAGHVPGARNIPHDQVAANLESLASSRDRTVVLYCRSGRRTELAAKVLHSAGFQRLRQLEGNYPAWADLEAAATK